MKNLWLRQSFFSESIIALTIFDVFICLFALTLSLGLFPWVVTFFGKPSISKEVLDFICLFRFRNIILLPLLNYFALGVKRALGKERGLGYIILAFNTCFYGGAMAFVFQKSGFQLKTFWMFCIPVFYGVLVVGRLFILKPFLKLPWQNLLSKSFLECILRIRTYFKEKPSAYFTIIFITSLLCSAIFLTCGREKAAEQVAVWGYLALVVSVSVELIVIFRRRDKNDEK